MGGFLKSAGRVMGEVPISPSISVGVGHSPEERRRREQAEAEQAAYNYLPTLLAPVSDVREARRLPVTESARAFQAPHVVPPGGVLSAGPEGRSGVLPGGERIAGIGYEDLAPSLHETPPPERREFRRTPTSTEVLERLQRLPESPTPPARAEVVRRALGATMPRDVEVPQDV